MQQGEGGSLLLAVFLSRRRVSGCFSFVVSCVVLCRTVSQTRRRISGRFPCVVSPSGGSAVWFRAATQSFGLFFLRRVLFDEFLRGERVGQARDEVSDQNRMMRISGATRYGVARMNRSHCARKYGAMIRYWL